MEISGALWLGNVNGIRKKITSWYTNIEKKQESIKGKHYVDLVKIKFYLFFPTP